MTIFQPTHEFCFQLRLFHFITSYFRNYYYYRGFPSQFISIESSLNTFKIRYFFFMIAQNQINDEIIFFFIHIFIHAINSFRNSLKPVMSFCPTNPFFHCFTLYLEVIAFSLCPLKFKSFSSIKMGIVFIYRKSDQSSYFSILRLLKQFSDNA